MPEQFQIEPMGDHDYLVHVRYSGGVIEETALYLTERQPVMDLPPMVDLDDVATAYGDQLHQGNDPAPEGLMRRRLSP